MALNTTKSLNGLYAAAIQLEDYASANSVTALSSVRTTFNPI